MYCLRRVTDWHDCGERIRERDTTDSMPSIDATFAADYDGICDRDAVG